MADETGNEKTEQPTAKKLRDAREKGQVARSKDLNSTVILLISAVSFLCFGKYMAQDILKLMKLAFSFNLEILKTSKEINQFVLQLATMGLISVIPFLIALFIASLLGPILLGGWSMSIKAIMPKLERLSPLKGFKRMVSLKGFMEMIKAFAKFLVIAACGIIVIKIQLESFMALGNYPVKIAITQGVSLLAWSFLFIASSLILISAIDVPFQLHEHTKQLKMTKQEVKDELKETEGKPEVKSKIRSTQQELARNRMMQEVPKADVILTNPTHYAVALNYDDASDKAPIVVAKGKDFIAMQINKVARAHDIPILSLPPLARAIYFSADINEEIHQELYVAVAQVLAYIFALRKKAAKTYDNSPDFLNELSIPESLQIKEEEDK
jgi:flagellar biosynthesis protein FlhB